MSKSLAAGKIVTLVTPANGGPATTLEHTFSINLARPEFYRVEWTNAIKNGLKTSSNFDYAAPLAEFVLLGNLAIRAQQTVVWDKDAMKVTNADAPNKFIKRPSYREGWFKA